MYALAYFVAAITLFSIAYCWRQNTISYADDTIKIWHQLEEMVPKNGTILVNSIKI
jgi:hypothetical protein